jgi:hypothetical protein
LYEWNAMHRGISYGYNSLDIQTYLGIACLL